MSRAIAAPSAARKADVALRPMRWWHIAAVTPMEAELFGEEQWSAAALWSELTQRDTRHYLVGLADPGTSRLEPAGSRVVGYGGLGVFGDEGWILTLGVTTGWQRRGIGARLLEALLSEGQRRGAAATLLEVRADNPVARRLYERHGFAAIGVRKGYYQPSGADAVVMRRA